MIISILSYQQTKYHVKSECTCETVQMKHIKCRMENSLRQHDEVEALSAIYGDEFCILDDIKKVYSIRLLGCGSKQSRDVILQFSMPESYPNDGPPIYEVLAPWLKGSKRTKLYDSLEQIYLENAGEDIIFMWSEKIREHLLNIGPEPLVKVRTSSQSDTPIQVTEASDRKINCPAIFHGEPITDRKSTFQAHVANVTKLEDVVNVRATLMLCKKIANATHNISAYRIVGDNGIAIQDCDDDGETAAGGRLLHLLNILNMKNVVAIVTRWYGGIQLGPDRFKHINNAARNALDANGFLKDSKPEKHV